jgi:cytochrome d ubiquinol oxidase subunit II
LTGALFVATGAYLAAVSLTVDVRRTAGHNAAAATDDDRGLEAYFARRAVVAGALAVAGLLALHEEARYAYDRLLAEGLPLLIASAFCGLAVLALLVRGLGWAFGRSPPAPSSPSSGAGVSPSPYLLPTSLKITESAAPDPTLDSVLVVSG